MICVKIQGKEWPLAFTLAAMDEIEDQTGKGIGELSLRVKSKEDRAEMIAVLAAMMRAGADGGETPDAEALRGMMRPGELLGALRPVSDAINEGMYMETEEPEEGEEVDVVLEDLKKKEPQAD